MEPRLQQREWRKKMNASKAAIMITIFFSMSQGKNHTSFSSIDAFLINLKKHHKINIKRRWIFYCFRWLLDNGYISRQSRHIRGDHGEITQIPSMISFTLKGVVWLLKRGVSKAKRLYNGIKRWLNKEDQRFPTKKDFNDGSWWPECPDERKMLKGLLGIATKSIS